MSYHTRTPLLRVPTTVRVQQMATLYQRLQVDRDNISVEEVDSVLRRMSYKKDQDLYNFWLEVRFDVVAEQVAIKGKESNE